MSQMNYVVVFWGDWNPDVVLFASGLDDLLDVVEGGIPGDDPESDEVRDAVRRHVGEASNWVDDRLDHRFSIGAVTIWRTEIPFPVRPGPNTRHVLEALDLWAYGVDDRLSVPIGPDGDDCIGNDVINAAMAENGLR